MTFDTTTKTARHHRRSLGSAGCGIQGYMRETAKASLLKPDEESRLATLCQRGLAAERELDRIAQDDKERRRRLERIADEGRTARHALVEANLRFVMSVAMRYTPPAGMEMADIIQAGNTGLLMAVDKFDPSTGNRLTSYAVHWIHQAIRKMLEKESRAIRLPADVHNNAVKIAQAINRTGDQSTESIVRETGLPVNKVDATRRADAPIASLDKPVSADINTPLYATLPAPGADSGYAAVDRELNNLSAARLLEKAMRECLTENERTVLTRRTAEKPETLKAIGEDLGLTKERVRQIERAAKKKMLASPYASQLLELAA